MKYIVGIAMIAMLWALARNWQQVQRTKARLLARQEIDERFARARANLDIAFANQKFDEAEYRRRLHRLHQEWRREHDLAE